MGMKNTWTIGTYYGFDQGFMQGSCVEEGRKEEKDGPLIRRGPKRPALLIGIKWECLRDLDVALKTVKGQSKLKGHMAQGVRKLSPQEGQYITNKVHAGFAKPFGYLKITQSVNIHSP